ncbi:hypothetical protein BKA70DRAFT_1442187 [Coprinopsis sp. MPI-PUGE-AT-0042]|nr:hypothetical protein BKA70DRAFT_1442187 [Coprinopsis sp. MPI-PUGE-AT-0042]
MPRYFHSVTSMQTSDISAESLVQPGRAVGNHTGNAARPIPFLPQELMIEVLEAFIGSIPLRDVRNELKNLALVCHSWLKIIRTTPSMWSRFYLHHEDFPKGAVPNNRLRPVLERWMKKAGDMPLELEAHFSSSAVHGPPVLAKVLRQSASRWRALKLHVFHLLDFGVDSRADAQGASDRIPVRWDRLESIELVDAWYSETSTHILPATPLMPRLQSLTLISGLHYIPHLVVIFPFKRLRRIVLAEVWMLYLGLILKECSGHLEDCTIHNPVLYSWRERRPLDSQLGGPGSVVLANVSHLQMRGLRRQEIAVHALNHILLPGLQELDIEFLRDEYESPREDSMPFIQNKLLRSHCNNLAYLTLSSTVSTQRTIEYFPTAIPSLRHLDLAHIFLDLDFLGGWNNLRSLPALEKFRLEILAMMWPKSSRVGLFQEDKLTGRDKQSYRRVDLNNPRLMGHDETAIHLEPRLPTELIIEVLHFFIMSIPASEVRKQRRNLLLVCQSWRRLIHSTPFMWHRIYVHPRDPPRIPDEHLESVLQVWMSKASQVPLELEGQFAYTWRGPSNDLPKVVRASSSKWKSLTLDGFHPLDFALDSGAPRRHCPSVRWDQLENIVMANATSDGWSVQDVLWMLPRPIMPKLRSLTIASGRHSVLHYLSIFPFNQLRFLQLANTCTPLRTVLKECLRLEECIVFALGGYASSRPLEDQENYPVPLKHLHTLTLNRFVTAPMIHDTFQPIMFPNLRELDIRFGRRACQPADSPVTTLLRGNFTQSGCSSLSKLTLWNPGGSQENLYLLLVAVPSLRHLDLSVSFFDLDFLAKCNSQKALPALERGKHQKDKLTGRDMVKLKYHRSQFNKFTSERGYKSKTTSAFPTSTWSVRVVQAELVLTTEFP